MIAAPAGFEVFVPAPVEEPLAVVTPLAELVLNAAAAALLDQLTAPAPATGVELLWSGEAGSVGLRPHSEPDGAPTVPIVPRYGGYATGPAWAGEWPLQVDLLALIRHHDIAVAPGRPFHVSVVADARLLVVDLRRVAP